MTLDLYIECLGHENIIFCDVEYSYPRQGKWYTPQKPESIELDSVKYGNTEITEILDEVQLEKIGRSFGFLHPNEVDSTKG